MQLMTKELEQKFPPLYATEGMNPRDIKIIAKFFYPLGGYTWYGLEFSPQDRIFFGYVIGHTAEFGYFSLDELESYRGKLGVGIERDLYFGEHTLGELFPERFNNSSGRREG